MMPHEHNDRLDETERTVLFKFGKHLRHLRENVGISQDALSNRADLHRTYVGAVERGERNPTFLTLRKYAAGLEITVEDLMRGF